jgi:hypothetical protein
MASGGARAQARFSWEKPFRVAPYIGILHPASSDRCGFSIYMLPFGFITDSLEIRKKKEDFLRAVARAQYGLCSI